MKLYYISLLFSLLYFTSTAQNEFAENWHFGSGCDVSFSTGTPIAGNSSAMFSYEGSVSISDASGQLMFYSNGGDLHQQNDGFVWDVNNQPMPNGTLFDTAGCHSAVQSSLVMPKPGGTKEYYLFTIDCLESGPQAIAHYKGLRYSVIDMSLNGGLGDVTVKGATINPGYPNEYIRNAEAITATRHSNGTDYWLVTNVNDTIGVDTFFVYLVSQSGISAPMKQVVGQGTGGGQLKISVDGSRLAYGPEVFDFNKTTGIISNPINVGEDGYGRALSPNGRYLYVANAFTLYQFDLQAANVAASKVTIHTGQLLDIKGSMQIGPDCKIYVAQWRKGYLGVINNPDAGGSACNYVDNQLTLASSTGSEMGLPNFIDSDFGPCNPDGIEEYLSNVQWSIYPNPAKDVVSIECEFSLHKWNVTVLNALGQQVLPNRSLQGNNGLYSIDISGLKTGLYYIRLEKDGNQFSKKVIKS
jgi:hypothetical protein